MRRFAFALLTASLLCACGQRGNLYLPDAEREAVSTSGAAAAPAATPAETPAATPAAGDAPADSDRDDAARNTRKN